MLSVMRIMTGLLLLQHGINKVFDFPVRPNHRPFELFTLVPGAAGTLELLGGLLIAVGLFTRPVAFVLAGEMAFAYFLAHAARGFFPLVNGGDLVVLFCFVFLYLFVAGGGIWSLDHLRSTKVVSGGTATHAAYRR